MFKLPKTSCGFTLIELLFTLTIVGILTAVAVPQYQRYVARAFDTRAKLDLHNVALAEEAYFADTERYMDCETTSCRQLPGITRVSKGVTLQIRATATGFSGTAKHSKGSRRFAWDSSQGGLVE